MTANKDKQTRKVAETGPKTTKSFKERMEEDTTLVVLGILFTGFGAGFGASTWIHKTIDSNERPNAVEKGRQHLEEKTPDSFAEDQESTNLPDLKIGDTLKLDIRIHTAPEERVVFDEFREFTVENKVQIFEIHRFIDNANTTVYPCTVSVFKDGSYQCAINKINPSIISERVKLGMASAFESRLLFMAIERVQ